MEKTKIDVDKLSDLQKTLYRDYSEDLQSHDDAIADFDAYEAMDMSKTYDSVSRETNNGLTDSMTSTIYLERAARVAGQLPDGETKAIGRKDYGKGLFMDILRTKWIYPNANAQRSFKTKMFMWQYGSSEYGYMPMYVDLNVSPSGYFGPDCWIWNPRNFIPQAGFTTVTDMDYCHAIAEKSPSFFQDILDDDTDDTWKKDKIREIIDQINNATKETDPKRDTLGTQNRQKQSTRQVRIATRYESGPKGRWISFLPDFGYVIIRNVKNPHRNSRIPFVIKPCIPKFDSFYNLGDFARSMPMQFANDGLDNFYFQGIKINLFPPIIINSQGVIRHTIRPGEAGSVWEETQPNSINRLETNTAGLSTYQAAKGMAKGAVQSIAGTTDTRANAENSMDPGMGKTPEALKMIQQRESTRDGQDRDFLEEAMTELMDLMYSMIPTITQHIPVDLFSDEVEEIMKSGYTDLADIFKKSKTDKVMRMRMSESGNQMRIRLNPDALKGLEYRFQLEAGSTSKKTKEGQLAGMVDFLGFIGKMPNALQEYREATGKTLNWEQVFSQYGKLADIPNMESMFMEAPAPKAPEAGATDGATPPETPPADGGGAISPEQLAQAAAMPPEQVAAGGMQPPAEDPLVVNGVRFTTPEGADNARQLLAEVSS
jgi:hypothetical protein